MGWMDWRLNSNQGFSHLHTRPVQLYPAFTFFTDSKVTMTTHLHLALKLRVSGAIPLLPLHTFVACMEHVYLFYLLRFTAKL